VQHDELANEQEKERIMRMANILGFAVVGVGARLACARAWEPWCAGVLVCVCALRPAREAAAAEGEGWHLRCKGGVGTP